MGIIIKNGPCDLHGSQIVIRVYSSQWLGDMKYISRYELDINLMIISNEFIDIYLIFSNPPEEYILIYPRNMNMSSHIMTELFRLKAKV